MTDTEYDHILELTEQTLGATRADFYKWLIENPEGDWWKFLQELGEIWEAKRNELYS